MNDDKVDDEYEQVSVIVERCEVKVQEIVELLQ